MLCDNCTRLNCVELVHNSFQAYYIFFCFLSIHSITFLEFGIETPTKILIYLLTRNNRNIQWKYRCICSVFSKSPENVLSYFCNLKKGEKISKNWTNYLNRLLDYVLFE